MHFRSLSPETRVTFAYYPPVWSLRAIAQWSALLIISITKIGACRVRGLLRKIYGVVYRGLCHRHPPVNQPKVHTSMGSSVGNSTYIATTTPLKRRLY
eukprot:1920367-Prymnesium_polylepis.1